jgi:hypothetical protein
MVGFLARSTFWRIDRRAQNRTMRRLSFLVVWMVAILSGMLAASATAMTLEVQGNAVFATGPVVDDLARFEQALATPGVDTVVFVNSPGGDLWTGLRVGRLIAKRGLRTVIAGNCLSACSIMFMGGRERRFADAFPPNLTFIGLHGAHQTDTGRLDPELQPQIYAFYRERMGSSFNTAVVNKALYEMDDSGAMLRVYDGGREPRRAPVHCRSAQTLRRDCTEFAGEDALSLGVVTGAAVLSIELPPSLRLQPAVFNQRLGGSVGAIQLWLEALAAHAETKPAAPSCASGRSNACTGPWPRAAAAAGPASTAATRRSRRCFRRCTVATTSRCRSRFAMPKRWTGLMRVPCKSRP